MLLLFEKTFGKMLRENVSPIWQPLFKKYRTVTASANTLVDPSFAHLPSQASLGTWLARSARLFALTPEVPTRGETAITALPRPKKNKNFNPKPNLHQFCKPDRLVDLLENISFQCKKLRIQKIIRGERFFVRSSLCLLCCAPLTRFFFCTCLDWLSDPKRDPSSIFSALHSSCCGVKCQINCGLNGYY